MNRLNKTTPPTEPPAEPKQLTRAAAHKMLDKFLQGIEDLTDDDRYQIGTRLIEMGNELIEND